MLLDELSPPGRLLESLYFNEVLPGIGHLKVFKNPSQSEYARAVASFHTSEARALLSNFGFYVWDSYLATHRDMRNQGLSGDRLILNGSSVVVFPYMSQDKSTPEQLEELLGKIKSSPHVLRALGQEPEVKVEWL